MAVSGFKVHMIWRNDSLAITEDYYWGSTEDNIYTTIYPAAQKLMAARTLMMGQGVVAKRFRISLAGAFRNYVQSKPESIATMKTGPFLLKVSLNAGQVAAGISDDMDGSADDAPAAILMDYWDSIASHGHKFLSGVPDVMIRTNPTGPWIVGVPSWNELFKAYLLELQGAGNKWRFRARVLPPAPPNDKGVAVTGVLFDQGLNMWAVEVPTLPVPAGAVGTDIQLQGFKMNSKAYVPMNGTFQVGSTAPSGNAGKTWYYLRGSADRAGTQILRFGYLKVPGFTLYPFTNVQLGEQTERKRGNRSLASPGRRVKPARVSA